MRGLFLPSKGLGQIVMDLSLWKKLLNFSSPRHIWLMLEQHRLGLYGFTYMWIFFQPNADGKIQCSRDVKPEYKGPTFQIRGLRRLTAGLEHAWILASLGVLGPIPHIYQDTTVFSFSVIFRH